MLKEVYGASHVALVPGGGTFAMEAVARQFAGGQDVLVVRNGWFSFRWSQILDAGGFAGEVTVMKARPTGNDLQSPYAPAPIDEVTAKIRETRPGIVFRAACGNLGGRDPARRLYRSAGRGRA